jgi:hypothetical protein
MRISLVSLATGFLKIKNIRKKSGPVKPGFFISKRNVYVQDAGL